jgi:hypothetical protein
MIVNSHFRPIKTYDFLKDCQIKKQICYEINEASQFIDTVTESYDCVVLHLFTNDVRDSENTESVSSQFELLVKKIHRKWSETKMLISMGISRGDSVKVNNKMLEYIYNIRTLSVNIKFICTSFRNRQNSEPSASFSDLFRSEYK